MTSLREAFDAEAAEIRALGDIGAAIATADTRSRRRVAATAGIVAAAAVALAVGLMLRGMPTQTPQPAAPAPSPSAVKLAPATATTPWIVNAPLRSGADVAGGQGAVVWSKGEPRVVLEDFRIYSVTLSPDGRYVAVTGKHTESLVLTDLTTGKVLVDRPLTTAAGVTAQSPHVLWSRDSQHLFLAVIATQDLGAATSPQTMARSELQVWSLSSTGTFTRDPTTTTLEGELVGVSPDGGRVLSTSDGRLTVLDRATGTWASLRLPAAPPSSSAPPDNYGHDRGGYCWSPDGQRVCSVAADASTGTVRVGWLDVEAGTWSVRDVTTVELSVVGWRDGRPVVARATAGGLVVEALTATGFDRLAAFEAVLSGPAGLSFSGRWDS